MSFMEQEPELECEDAEERPTEVLVEELQKMGINVADIKKLREASLTTVSSILMTTRKDLGNIKGFSEAKVQKLIDSAIKLMPSFGGFQTGSECLIQRRDIRKLSTGCTALNDILGGGIESMSITEVFGEFRTGKTMLCHTVAVTAQLSISNGGGSGKVVFVDTEGTFRPGRIQAIADRLGLDRDEVLENILVARVYTTDAQIEVLKGIAMKMSEDHFALVVVDSAMALFRVDFSGRGQLSERQQKLGTFMSQLRKLADQFNVAILITNQVMSDPSGAMTFVADPKKPVGGHVMAHASTTRLYLRKGRGDQRICKIYDSPDFPEVEAIYQLTEGGISDATD
uniref:Uncharacterized protein n=1 Tax=Spongospora subterranea TaxID=70186 RepID=A0A0H5R7P1_9EUKA|eukprot:CRZ10185.1 hypothetical protein [Spongospora subterranea]